MNKTLPRLRGTSRKKGYKKDMLITLDKTTFRDGVSLGEIEEAVSHWMSIYPPNTLFRVFVVADQTVSYIEAVHEMLSISSSSHKLIEDIKSPYPELVVTLRSLYEHVRYCVAQSYD